MAARVVQLYIPAHNATIDDFMITPSMDGEAFAASVKAAFRRHHDFDLEGMWPFDINAEPLFEVPGCPSAFKDIAHGERILIAMDEDESVFAEPDMEVVLFLEDDNLPKALRVSTLLSLNTYRLRYQLDLRTCSML